MPENMTGACHCRSVQYTIKGDIKTVANCHCTICKKVTGGAFQTIVFVDKDSLAIQKGEELLTSYQVTENATRHFCRVCGTPLFNTHKAFPGSRLLSIGSLDDPTLVAPALNVFCENMLPWVRQIGDLPSFDREPPRE